MQKQYNEGPWYQQFWAWFILAPLIVVIIACAITVSIALRKADDVVRDDYYQEGRMINRDFAAEEHARALNIQADVQFDWLSGEVWVQLNRDIDYGAQLQLQFSHPARAELDRHFDLKHVDSQRFRADLSERMSGRWYLVLIHQGNAETDGAWRLHGEIDLARSDRISLSAPTKENH